MKRRSSVSMDLEKAYDRVDTETLWQVMRKYDECGKL